MYSALIDGRVVKEGHFILRSGKHSNKYISKDKIITIPLLYSKVISQLNLEINKTMNRQKKNFDVVTGPAVAGISFAAPVALNLGKIFVYPEKEWDSEGCCNSDQDFKMSFRSDFQETLKDKDVILIEDAITTAGSIIKTIDAVKRCGGNVVAVYCIWNRNSKNIKYIYSLPSHSNAYIVDSVIRSQNAHIFHIPIYSLVSEKVESWESDVCPICKEGIPLIDPKTGKEIK